jgi:VWFA-related protein
MRIITALAVAGVLLFAHLAIDAQRSDDGPEAERYRFNARSDLVFLPTRVQKKNGDTLHGLRPEQFIVEDNGVRQPVQVEAAPESSSLSIVVLVQCSRTAPSTFANLKGLATMIEGIVGNSRYEVAIVGYGERPYVLGGFSGDAGAARTALSRLTPCGDSSAATVDAVEYSVGLLRSRPKDYRRAILLVGEMRDHGSSARLNDAVADLGTTDTVIYSVAFSPVASQVKHDLRGRGYPKQKAKSAPGISDPIYTDRQPNLELPPEILPMVNALRQNTASELASLSGGDYMSFNSRRAFDEDIQRVSNQIRNYYLLSFRPPAGSAVGLHSVRIRIAGNHGAVIQGRRTYWYGSAR